MDRRLEYNRHSQTGLTLIELLIVMLIIALAASVVALNAPPPAGKARIEADRFAMRINLASELAVTTGALIGLELTPGGYRFFQYERGDWKPVDAVHLRDGVFPVDVAVAFELTDAPQRNEAAEDEDQDDDASKAAPNLLFTPTGETTAIKVDFQSRRAMVSLLLDNVGGLKVVRHAERK